MSEIKKILLILLLALFPFLGIAQTSFSVTHNGVEMMFTKSSGTSSTCEVSSVANQQVVEVAIPDKVTYGGATCTVTKIGDRAFQGCRNLISVELPPTITAIGSRAFATCESLESINLPEGLVSIGGYGFQSCKSLKAITLPKSLTSIGEQAFNSTALTSVEIPDGVTTIARYAFAYTPSLKSVKLPKNLKSIAEFAFDNDGLTSIELPNSLTSIGAMAFARTKLTKVVIPNSVTSISSFAFDRCEDLKSVVLPAKLANLENNVFRRCTSLTSVVLPPSLTRIGGRAFLDCSALDTVYLGANIAEIGDSAFYNNKLRNLYITRQTKVPTVGGKSFYTSSSSARTLYVQGTSAKTSFGTTWNGFTTATMTTPGGLKDYTGAATTSFSSTKSSALPYQEGTTTAQVSASFSTDAPSIPYIFYTSSDPAKLYVDNEGRITVASSYKVTDGVTITAETLYANGPKITYTPATATLNYTYDNTAKTATVTGASDKNITSIDIPSTVTNGGVTYTVTSIGRGAFGNTDTSNGDAVYPYLISVKCPSTLKSIGNYAFRNVKTLETINLPEGLTTIGERAFNNVIALKTLDLPKTLTSIGDQCFNGLRSITYVEIPDGITSLPSYAFGYCWALKSVKLPKNLKTIDRYAFDMVPITSIELPNTLTSIGDNAFARTTLKTVVIPNSVTTMGDNAFSQDPATTVLESVELSNSLTYIPKNAFRNCTKLKTVVIPPSVTEIRDEAFYQSTNLATVYMGSGVKSIGANAFGKTKISNLYIGCNTPPTIGTDAFISLPATRSVHVPNNSKTQYDSAGKTWNGFNIVGIAAGDADPSLPVRLGEKGKIIATGVQSSAAVSATVPCQQSGSAKCTATVAAVNPAAEADMPFAFWRSSDQSKVYVDNFGRITMLPAYKTGDNVTITAETLYYNGPVVNLTLKNIGEGLTYRTIDATTCAVTGITDKNTVTEVVIPSTATISGKSYTVTQIDAKAFMSTEVTPITATWPDKYEVSPLWSVTLPATLQVIGNQAFQQTSLTSIEIPESVTSIGQSAFLGCTAMVSAKIPSKLTEIQARVFEHCKALETINTPQGLTKIGDYAFLGCLALKEAPLAKTLTSIGNQAFNACNALTSVEIPDGVTVIPSYGFAYCENLRNVKLPRKLEAIKSYAFDMTPIANDLEFASTLTTIERNAFARAEFKEVVIPNSVTTLGEYAFDRNSNMESLTISNSLTAIPDYAFRQCTKLTTVVIPPAVTTIGQGAFANCTGLTKVYMGPNITTINNDAFKSTKVNTLYITSLTKPATVGSTAFDGTPASRTLFVQNAAAKTNYGTTWNGFTTTAMASLPTGMEGFNELVKTNFSAIGKATLPCQEGAPALFTASLYPAANADIPYIFWTSSDFTKLFIDQFGNMTPGEDFSFSDKVTITARSLYANSPVLEFTISKADLIFEIDPNVTYQCRLTGATNKDLVNALIPSMAIVNGRACQVVRITADAFKDFKRLTSVEIPSIVNTIEAGAFAGSGLQSVSLHSGITTINDNTFLGCTALKSADLPGATAINASAFSGCSALVSVNMPSVKSIGNEAFNGCAALNVSLPAGLTTLGTSAFKGSGIATASIPSGVATVPVSAFESCTKLSSLTLANGVKTIGEKAFYNCSALTSVTIPSSVTTLGTYCFGYTALTSVTIPATITSIEREAFDNCKQLKTVYYNSSAPISQYMFYSDSALTSVTFGSSAKPTTINSSAFYSCKALTSFNIPASVTTIGSGAFRLSGLTSITVPSSVTSCGSAFKDCTALTSATSNNSAIGSSMFSGCTALTTVTLSSSVKTIGANAFEKCTGLASFTIPTTVTSVGANAFDGCSKLATLVLPNNTTKTACITLGNYAFKGTGVKSISLPAGITTIPEGLFQNCTALTEVALRPTVTAIGANAFSGCTALTTVHLGNVSSIGANAFADDNALTKLYSAGTSAPTLGSGAFPTTGTRTLYLTSGSWTLTGFTKGTISKAAHHVEISKVSGQKAPAYEDAEIEMIGEDTPEYLPSNFEDLRNTPTHIYAENGESFVRTAQAVAADGSASEMPHAFWSSDDPAKVYVSNDGKLQVMSTITPGEKVAVHATSLAGGTQDVILENYHLTGVDEIFDEGGAPGTLDPDAPAEVFTLDGMRIGDSINNLAPGIYIIRQGKLTVKITVR